MARRKRSDFARGSFTQNRLNPVTSANRKTQDLVSGLLGAKNISEFLKQRDIAKATAAQGTQSRELQLIKAKRTGVERLSQARTDQLLRRPLSGSSTIGKRGERRLSITDLPSPQQGRIDRGESPEADISRLTQATTRETVGKAKELEASARFIKRAVPGSATQTARTAPGASSSISSALPSGSVVSRPTSFQNLNVGRESSIAPIVPGVKTSRTLKGLKTSTSPPVTAADLQRFSQRNKALKGKKRKETISRFAIR